ncbi:MAG TPA: diaminopimelate epimerase [Chromatiales bacterium]|nr:diaminopimelate epimerase [Chromatiales bacterium]
MTLTFTKMHGLGNDFMLVDANGREPPAPADIRRLADRRRGVGFDQLLWLEPPRSAQAQVYYRIFNADGGEVEQCGNGARCIARYVGRRSPGAELLLEHPAGKSRARLLPDGTVSVEMGVPDFDPASVPFVTNEPADSYAVQVGADTVQLRVVSIGNPHAMLIVEDIDNAPVSTLGPALERHERFPNRANIGFMQILAPDHARLRVFERGAGETQACGTGACAAAVLGQQAGLLDAQVRMQLPGGTLQTEWHGAGEPVWLTGEAVFVFEGTVEV